MDVEGGQPVRREGEDTPLVVNTSNVEARSSEYISYRYTCIEYRCIDNPSHTYAYMTIQIDR
jgi:hypothetical protein